MKISRIQLLTLACVMACCCVSLANSRALGEEELKMFAARKPVQQATSFFVRKIAEAEQEAQGVERPYTKLAFKQRLRKFEDAVKEQEASKLGVSLPVPPPESVRDLARDGPAADESDGKNAVLSASNNGGALLSELASDKQVPADEAKSLDTLAGLFSDPDDEQ